MTAPVIIAPRAEADIKRVLKYLTEQAGFAVADRYQARFGCIFERLGVFPTSGSPRPEFGPTMRTVVVEPYLIFYDSAPDLGTCCASFTARWM
jgi:plasmid stabilization system protein ParE